MAHVTAQTTVVFEVVWIDCRNVLYMLVNGVYWCGSFARCYCSELCGLSLLFLPDYCGMVIYSGGVVYNMCLPIPRTCSVKKLVNSLFLRTDSKTTRFSALCVVRKHTCMIGSV